MSNPCQTCQPMPTCVDGLERYSLQEDMYLFVLNCPPGFSCQNLTGDIGMLCCDGTEMQVTIPPGSDQALALAILQAMLNDCARRFAFCDPIIPPDPPEGPGDGISITPTRLYFNSPQSHSVQCPDGSVFTYTVRAGRYLGFSLDAANQLARAEAIRQAVANRMCLTDLPLFLCADTAQNEEIRVTTANTSTAYQWSLMDGTLPPGLALPGGWVAGKTAYLTGTPTTGGTYTFTLRATSTSGLYAQRQYTVCVIEISCVPAGATDNDLPDGIQSTPYSVTLTAPACATPPLSWQITAGALPGGLTLDESTGVISGTPDMAGDFNITVLLQTEAT